MHNAFRTIVFFFSTCVGLSAAPVEAASERLLVFAAASTREAVLSITKQASIDLGVPVVASFAASSTLARQIEAGAPAHLYLSASRAWMDRLEREGAIAGETRHDLVRNQLVLIAPRIGLSLIHISEPTRPY